jgi:hypothetical protein
MSDLYAIFMNGSLMRAEGKGSLVSQSKATIDTWKEALDLAADLLGEKEEKYYEVVPYTIDLPVKNYAEQGIPPKPEDFMAVGNITAENIEAIKENWKNIDNSMCKVSVAPTIIPHAESDDREIEETLHEELRNKIERTASKVPTKEVWGIYSRDDKPVTSEFHRDGQHVLFLTQKMAEDYVNRIQNFVPFGVYSKKKVVPVTQKVIGDGIS